MAPTSCFNGQVHRLPDAPEAYGAMITRPKAAPAQSRSTDLNDPAEYVAGGSRLVLGPRQIVGGPVSAAMKRSLAGGVAVVIAAAIGLVTNIATDRPSIAWWVALGALLVIGVGTQIWLTSIEAQQATITAMGAGSVAVGGSTHGSISTRIRGASQSSPPASTQEGTNAQGPGSIAIGGEAKGDLTTDIEDA